MNLLQVLAALQYYAFGGYQRSVGNDYKLGLAQQTVSACLAEVTNALNEPHILRKYIKFPRTETERVHVSREFNDKFGFPGVLGCIDGTHIAIIRPGQYEEAYFNRKYYHSLNVMVVSITLHIVVSILMNASLKNIFIFRYVMQICALHIAMHHLVVPAMIPIFGTAAL